MTSRTSKHSHTHTKTDPTNAKHMHLPFHTYTQTPSYWQRNLSFFFSISSRKGKLYIAHMTSNCVLCASLVKVYGSYVAPRLMALAFLSGRGPVFTREACGLSPPSGTAVIWEHECLAELTLLSAELHIVCQIRHSLWICLFVCLMCGYLCLCLHCKRCVWHYRKRHLSVYLCSIVVYSRSWPLYSSG